MKSKFAQELEIGRRKRMEKRRSTAAGMRGSLAEKGQQRTSGPSDRQVEQV